jgi:catechol 2,3-dioxygenase-like lactoylglutathione lyase family enzyme
MQFKQIKETCLYVKDLEKTEDFYHSKLDMEIIGKVKERHVFFKAGGSVLLCFINEATRHDTKLPPHYGLGNIHLAFETKKEEYDLWKKKIHSLGIPIEHEQEWHKGYRSFYFRDPDGHLLEIVQEGMWD